MNKKKNNRKIISVLIVLACFVLFAGVLFTGIRNYKTEKKENPVQGVSSESSLKGYLGKGYAYAGAQDNISAERNPLENRRSYWKIRRTKRLNRKSRSRQK